MRLKKKHKRMIHRAWQFFIKFQAAVSLFSLFVFTPAWKYGYSTFPKVIVVLNCLYLFIFVLANIDEV